MRFGWAWGEGSYDREVAFIGRASPLVVDELDFSPLDLDGVRPLLKICADAYER